MQLHILSNYTRRPPQPTAPNSIRDAVSGMERLELLVEDLSKADGFGALLAYRATVRDLRIIIERAGAGDQLAISRLSSVGLALEGLLHGVRHVASSLGAGRGAQ